MWMVTADPWRMRIEPGLVDTISKPNGATSYRSASLSASTASF